MMNASDRYYPAIAARKPRGTTQTTLTNPNGLLYKNKLFYVDGTRCYYDGSEISGLTVSNDDKRLVGMGAYICIFPDKVMYNTSSGEVKQMESSFPTSGTTSATFAPLTTGSVFTKITATGIHNAFSQYDGVTIAGCTNAEFNATKVITEIGTNYIVVTGKLDTSFTQASGLTFKRTVPDFDYVCEWNNRLWACSSENHEIYACKLGDPTNWNCYEGISTDSYVLTIGSDGDFTGCIAHLGHVLFFKESAIHMMYGDKPSNFSLTSKTLPGVKEGCADSLEIVGETLYYVGINGVYAFDGAFPQKVSDNITGSISDAVSTQEDGRLYVSCLLDSQQTVLVYDPRLRIWDKENDDLFMFAAYGDGRGYFINADGTLCTLTGNDTDIIDWIIESGDIKEGSMLEKYVAKLMFNFWLAAGTVATIYIKCDDFPMWIRKGSITAVKDTNYTIPIIPQRCNKYRYMIEFHGDGKLLSAGRYVEGGTELNGTVFHGYRN